MDSDDTPAPTIPSKIGRFFIRLFLGPPSLMLRVKFFLTGCLFPAVGVVFVLAGAKPFVGTLWQSGAHEVYVSLLLSRPCQFVFLPLIAFSMAGLAAWIYKPDAGRFLVVRLAVYFGIPFAAQYLYFLTVTSNGVIFIIAAIVAPLLAFVVFAVEVFATPRTPRNQWLQVPVFLGMTVLAAVIIVFLPLVPVFILGAAPVLNLATYLRASLMIAREQYERRKELRSLLHWLFALQGLAAAWFASWRIALDTMLLEYSKLPTNPPGCYVSTAASRRHAWLFREPHCGVSLQTKRLKFLEIALRCAAPRLHALLRRIYDQSGPPFAALCGRNPWFADATYLLLLPLELVAALLQRSLRIPTYRIRRLYSLE